MTNHADALVPTATVNENPWHTKYPAPRTTNPLTITREELYVIFTDDLPIKDYTVLVDVRRTDHEVSL